VLTLNPAEVGLSPTPGNRIWGLLVEIGYPGAVATLVTIADGAVSLYFSNGGGVIGIGQHEGPRKAAGALLAAAPAFLGSATPASSFPLPAQGHVTFYFLTFDGILTSDAGEDDLKSNRHPLSPLFHGAHDVITQARLVDEGRVADEQG
jgi:hypothetical protein